MPTLNEKDTFAWLGDGKISYGQKDELHYRAFQHGDLEVKCGDYVLIRNEMSLNFEDLHCCFVAQVQDLYDKGNSKKNLHQAVVQWYSRITDIPSQHQQYLEDEHEVIQEARGWSKVVNVETIFGKCKVIFLPECAPTDMYVKTTDDNGDPIFYCKWRYDGSKLSPVCASSSKLNPAFQQFVVSSKEKKKVTNGLRHSQKCLTDGERRESSEIELLGIHSKKAVNKNCETGPELLTRKSRRKRILVQMKCRQERAKDVCNIAATKSSGTPIKKMRPVQRTKYGRKIRPTKAFNILWKDDVESESEIELNAGCQRLDAHYKKVNSLFSDSEDSYVPSDDSNDSDNCEISSITGKKVSRKKYITQKKEHIFKSAPLSKSVKKVTKKRKIEHGESKSIQTIDALSLLVPSREGSLMRPKNSLEEAREKLHASVVPDILSCREHEYSDIYTFVKGKLLDGIGGSMYISGVPGTGKTATVLHVVKNLKKEAEKGAIPIFKFVEVNGMRITEPHQCYIQILKAVTGEKAKAEQASEYLQEYFTGKAYRKEAVFIMIDELDLLWTRKQTVLYNLFEWPSHSKSKLIVVAIANTMDLPERMMKNRVISRLGLTRMAFQPYSFKQLKEIILSRMETVTFPDPFDPDAIQLAARKVAAVSGDARRLLDICRRSTEIAEEGTVKLNLKKGYKYLVGIAHIEKALQEMFSSPMILAIRAASLHEKIFLKSVISEFQRTGKEVTVFASVYEQHVVHCRFEGIVPPSVSEAIQICVRLGSIRIIQLENNSCDVDKRIQLNISVDDALYALEELRKM